jgi:L-glyceraldehyde 3-phosphate reductase
VNSFPADDRYDKMIYRRCGRSGLKLPAVSLGLWHSFGFTDDFENSRALLRTAFDLGITHFDLANNYGPPYGSAEKIFGKIFKIDFEKYRDELIISTKAGYDMWPGPYGNWGSRKYLLASLDQSLKRMELDYVDIFYHHRPDPETPLEETMAVLDSLVRQGKALYVGISNYDPEQTKMASRILNTLGTPCLIHQPVYNMFDRWIESGLLKTLKEEGIGCIAFSPLAQGLLTEKYIEGIPEDSRVMKDGRFLKPQDITEEKRTRIRLLNQIAKKRGQKLAQMSIAWILRLPGMTSVLIGASKVEQIRENVEALQMLKFSDDELNAIDQIIK